MEPGLRQILALAQGPLFRFAFALMLLGLLRQALLALAQTTAAFALESRHSFWRKLRLRIFWQIFPPAAYREIRIAGGPRLGPYHWFISITALIFHLGIVLVPTFMIVHVYLWERAGSMAWPSLPGRLADGLALVTVVSGLVLFFAQLYSRFLRRHEPVWSFFRPLILLLPFLSGVLSMHPTWCPVDYYVVMAIHTLSAAVVFVLVPFARLLSAVHTPLAQLLPEFEWSRTRIEPALRVRPLLREVAV